MTLRQYIEEELAGEVADRIKGRRQLPRLWRPNGWLYEGTVRAEIYTCIRQHREFKDEYLLYAEQSYGKTYPDQSRADLMLFTAYDEDDDSQDRFVIFEVKSEYDPNKIQKDIEKLFDAFAEFRSKLINGYAFYCVSEQHQASWSRRFKECIASSGPSDGVVKSIEILVRS